MGAYRNGMSASSIETKWVKSNMSTANGQCVELGALTGGRVAMRNSTDPDGPALVFSALEIEAFVDGAKKGEFDAMCVN
ncbi:DUF397 domain-containing protein [Streptomyces sp. NPDC059118]|uniref:DUF397 domain-containing protein n=1 Tax=unclassified Streptomyces TaxID=2593676 RepID=UPI0036B6D1FD